MKITIPSVTCLITLYLLAGCSAAPDKPAPAYCLNGAGQAFVCGQPPIPPEPVIELPDTQTLLAQSKAARAWLQSQRTPASTAAGFSAQLAAYKTLPGQWPAAAGLSQAPLISYPLSKRLSGFGFGPFNSRQQARDVCRTVKSQGFDCLIYQLKPGVEVRYHRQ